MLAVDWIWHAYHSDIAYRRMYSKDVFDLKWVDVDTPGDDQVGAPVTDVQIAIRIDVTEVAVCAPAMVVDR